MEPLSQMQQQQPIPPSILESLYQQPIHEKPVRVIVARSYTIIVLFISIVLHFTAKGKYNINTADGSKGSSVDVTSLVSPIQRYVLVAIILGSATNIAQLGLVIYFIITGKYVNVNKYKIFFDYYADKILSLLLAAMVGAQLASTFDLKTVKHIEHSVKNFFKVDKISSIILATAIVSTAISSSCSEKAMQSYWKSMAETEKKVGIFRTWVTRIYNFFSMKWNSQG